MAYTLDVEKRKNYLYITVKGENSRATVMDYLAEVHQLRDQYNSPDVLVVENLSGPGLPTFTIYDIVSKLSEKVPEVIGKIAYVDINPDHDKSKMKFAETAALNRGVFVQVFHSIQAAEDWLEQQAKPEGKDGGQP